MGYGYGNRNEQDWMEKKELLEKDWKKRRKGDLKENQLAAAACTIYGGVHVLYICMCTYR
jgi:hypothetical protein